MVASFKRGLGVALSGGAAHGIAHIGVLAVLEREQVPISAIAGVSAGSIVGAACAAGVSTDELEKAVRRMRWRDVFRVVPGKMGLLSLEPLTKFMERLLPVHRFENLERSLYVGVTDLESGRTAVINRGELVPAVIASCALPGLVPPIVRLGRYYVDGGVSCSIPTHVLRRARLDVVLASDVNHDVTRFAHPTNLFAVLMQSMYAINRHVARSYLDLADFVVAPRIGDISWQDLDRADELFKLGAAAMEEQLPELLAVLRSSPTMRRMTAHLARRRSAGNAGSPTDVLLGPTRR